MKQEKKYRGERSSLTRRDLHTSYIVLPALSMKGAQRVYSPLSSALELATTICPIMKVIRMSITIVCLIHYSIFASVQNNKLTCGACTRDT